jgi:signal transduction histidine kinase
VPIAVDGGGIGRFGQDVEAAVYFSCLEALQNVAKYAEATRAAVRLRDTGGHLTFEVWDDG